MFICHTAMCCFCPDCSFGLVFRQQCLPEEQLEHSGRDAGDDLCYRHPGVSHLQFWYQDPGHAPSAEAAEDPEAATVSGSPRDAGIYTQINTLRKQTTTPETVARNHEIKSYHTVLIQINNWTYSVGKIIRPALTDPIYRLKSLLFSDSRDDKSS